MITVAPITRKRSRIALDSDSDPDSSHNEPHTHPQPQLQSQQQQQQRLKSPSPALSSISDTLKRTRTQCELDELSIVPPQDAWPFDIDALLASPRLSTPPTHPTNLPAHDNWARYNRDKSILILCVQGNLQLHYELLCTALQTLYTISPTLLPLLLVHNPQTHKLSPRAPFSLPLVQAATPSYNHFVRLGLLHPLGGGKFPLDALVVIDSCGRRRLVLPFGWGAGRHADSAAGGGIQGRLMGLLRECVEGLEGERGEVV
ncbi:hypothetical protein T440DRAFT_464959 [Plenodomus tracheiphilus IPT5]|uniref:Uncharacterized protein n=1 Tax=Plenodomus tracheiphilus IPT5 TaxID=1408161 RepID=A0A6A7BJ76_9PLEO|nr:hypothetical protein T440DRAFT_464959 [Plenodomus tracheiphilus IPT5]